jgi:hypothetical protein
VPVVIAGQPDVIPAERSHVSKQRVVDGTTFPECIHGSLEVHRVPERDGGDHEIQTAGSVALIFIGAIPDLTQPMEEHRPRERVPRLSLVGMASRFGSARTPMIAKRLISLLSQATTFFHFMCRVNGVATALFL